MATLKSELQQLHREFETLTSMTTTLKKDFEKGRREKLSAERQAKQALKKVDEAERRCEVAEKNSKNATSAADKAKKKAASLEKEKLESQRLAVERLAAVERAEQQCNTLQREREELIEVYSAPSKYIYPKYIYLKEININSVKNTNLCILQKSSDTFMGDSATSSHLMSPWHITRCYIKCSFNDKSTCHFHLVMDARTCHGCPLQLMARQHVSIIKMSNQL